MFDTYTKASTDGALSRLLARMLPVWRDRPDSEHEQAVIRLLVGSVAVTYLLLMLFLHGRTVDSFLATIVWIVVFFIVTLLIIVWLVISPGKNIPRRLLGCITDIGGATLCLLLNGNLSAPIFVVYLWVIFGNGFRFGRPYLFLSMVLSLFGFCAVLLFSDGWSTTPHVTIGLLTGLAVLPLYVSSLLKRLEKALDASEVANQAMSSFLATMSHEIRTPLNGIIGILDLLGKTNLNKKQHHFVDLLGTSSEWLLQVISDGLDFTKIEANELIIDSNPANLKNVLKSVAEVFSEVTSNQNVCFVSRIDPNIPDVISCDQFRIVQILNNLLNNAFKFTDMGEVLFTVECTGQTSKTAEIRFSVSDTGCGIEEEHLVRIFEPFRQADISTSRHHGGTGLGLTIVSRIVKLMGGEIQVKSGLGVGTTFSFQLDFIIGSNTELVPVSVADTSPLWQRKPAVLLVEDNEINREVAINLLEHLGCNVITADNGLLALQAVTKKQFDVILMDCQMPHMDGYEATKKIQGMNENLAKVPIIALTAHITKQDREKCLEAGMVDYMGKPYRGEQLEFLLRKWLPSLVTDSDVKMVVPLRLDRDEQIQSKDTPEQQNTVHNLRNALTGVIGGTELALISKNEPKELEKQLDNIYAAAKRATKIATKL